MPEKDCLILFEKSFADQIDHPRGGTARINGIEQQALIPGKQLDCFTLRIG